MEIMHLLDRLEAVLTSGSRLPWSSRTVIDEHECLDIVDQLRVAVPEEVKQAKRLQAERDRILEDAESQAARIVAHAQEQAAQMIQQHEIVRQAEARAGRILEDMETEAAERKKEADRYAAESLARLEARLSETLAVVRNGLRVLGNDRDDDQAARV